MRPRWIGVSIGLHALFVLVLLEMYSGFVFGKPEPVTREIVAIALPPLGTDAPRRAAPPARAPQGDVIVVPRVDAPAPAPPPVTTPIRPGGGGADSGARRGVPMGGGGLALGPVRGDPRLWVGPMYIPEGGGRAIDMDSVVRRRLLAMADMADLAMANDSLSPLENPFATPQWVFERNGKKYGIDQQAIHFGSFSIPTALLAFLPIPQGNIDQARSNQQLMAMRADILRAAARAEAEDDFRRAVERIRERKDRERREQRQREDEERRRNRDHDRPLP